MHLRIIILVALGMCRIIFGIHIFPTMLLKYVHDKHSLYVKNKNGKILNVSQIFYRNDKMWTGL